jgi:hypothetical protein
MRNNTAHFKSSDILPKENKYTICKGGTQRIGSFILASINVTPRQQDDRMSNNEEFAAKIPVLLQDSTNPNNQIWVRATKATKEELNDIPDEVLNHESFPHLKYTAFQGIKARLQKRERMYKDNTEQFHSSLDVLPKENKYTICKGGAQQIGSFILASINVTPRRLEPSSME